MFYRVNLGIYANWLLYSHVPKSYEILGTIEITDAGFYRVGALAQNLETGLYCMFNAGVLTSLDQNLVLDAIDRYNKRQTEIVY